MPRKPKPPSDRAQTLAIAAYCAAVLGALGLYAIGVLPA